MIPPIASLVKYDNPVLVSRNTDKKTPRVSKLLITYWFYIEIIIIQCPNHTVQCPNHSVIYRFNNYIIIIKPVINL